MAERLSVIQKIQVEKANKGDDSESLNWADEIITVDQQGLQSAIEKAGNEWVLFLDTDEQVSPELKGEIQKLLQNSPAVDGFRIPRRSYFSGKWIKHCGWYPDYQVRLFRKSKVKISGSPDLENITVDGSTSGLVSDIISRQNATLRQTFAKINRDSSLQAMTHVGHKKVRWYHLCIQPIYQFFAVYFFKKGFLDGFHGLLLSSILSFNKIVQLVKIWEFQHNPEEAVQVK